MDLSKLNDAQKQAVVTTEGPLMVLAGAGSGKTRVLTYRIAYLISELGIAPSSILALTFTNKAAREMLERVVKLIGKEVSYSWISTFHSFGARFLRSEIKVLPEYNSKFQIIDDEDQEKIVKKIIKEKDFDTITYQELIAFIGKKKNLESVDHFRNLDSMNEAFQIYQNRLIKDNILDFDDLLWITYRILKENPNICEKYQRKFQYIMVDEFQDTNKIQFMLIDLLKNKQQNVFVVGDLNQSIYSFRGARIENIYQFAKDYGIKENPDRLIKLEENYRSTSVILDIANDIISKNGSFYKMKLYTSLGEGKKATLFEADTNYGEVVYVIKEINKLLKEGFDYRDIAILYRVNALSLNFETEFIKQHIPYVIYGGVGYFSRKEVKDILAYIRLALNKEDDFSFRRIVNMPKRKIGDKQIEELTKNAVLKNVSLYNAIDPSNKLLYGFKLMMEKISESIDKTSLTSLIDFVYEETGYKEMLTLQDEDERIANVMELKSIMKDLMEQNEGKLNHEILEDFLQDLALKTDVDNIEENDNKVKLMSFHQAKGLEYKVVFMVAMEHGIFPSYKSYSNEADLEEERRICYVGVTRAKQRLYLTYARRRRLYGIDSETQMSEFLKIINHKHLESKSNQTYQPKYNNILNSKPKQKDEDVEDSGIDVGDKILHKTFGQGMVVARDKDLITVAFSVEYGIKVLLRTHPTITKL